MNSLYLEYISNNPYENIKSDLERLYKRSRTRDEKIALNLINEIMISKYVDIEEPFFTYRIDDLIRDAEEYRWKNLVILLDQINRIRRPVTKQKFNTVLAKANEDYDLNNNNVKNLKTMVYLSSIPVGNNNRNNKEGAIWVGKITNGGRRCKTHKRSGKKRYTRRK